MKLVQTHWGASRTWTCDENSEAGKPDNAMVESPTQHKNNPPLNSPGVGCLRDLAKQNKMEPPIPHATPRQSCLVNQITHKFATSTRAHPL